MTPVGMPALPRAAIASSRRCGAEARGSIARARSLSSVVIETKTSARLRLAMSPRMSMSRVMSALGDDAHGIVELAQHTEDLAGDLQLALDRLVGIGVGAHGDHVGAVFRRGELRREQLGGVGLEQDLGLEIEAGREAEIGVGRPREAVDAAVLAAAIGIDRAVEADVGRGVARDDGARGVARQCRAQRRQFLIIRRIDRGFGLPAVGRANASLAVETARLVRERAAAAMHGFGDRIVGIVGRNGRPHDGSTVRTNSERVKSSIRECKHCMRSRSR